MKIGLSKNPSSTIECGSESNICVAQPKVIITLGNAALKVLANLIRPDKKIPGKLSPSSELYGTTFEIIGPSGKQITFLPLAHPAAPKIYQIAHDSWVEAGALKKRRYIDGPAT